MPRHAKIEPETLAKLACAYSGVAWGVFWIPLRAMDQAGLVGAWATVVFYAIPLILLVPLIVWRWRRLLAGGLGLQLTGICTALALVLYADAVLYTEVVPAMLLFYLTPVWSTLLARIFLGEAVTPVRWVTLALGLAGMYVMLAGETGLPWPSNIGDWMGLGAGVMWAVCAVRMRQDETNDPMEFTVSCFFWGCVVALAIALSPLEGPSLAPSWSTIQAILPWLLPVLIVVVMSGTFAAMWGTPRLNPGTVAILFMTEISVGTVTAAIWAGEPFGLREIVGVVLITGAGLAESLPLPRAWRGLT